MKVKFWDNINQEWLFKDDNKYYPDIQSSPVDEDGYCSCTMCQEQKILEIKKQEKVNLVPDDLFEL